MPEDDFDIYGEDDGFGSAMGPEVRIRVCGHPYNS